MVTRNPLLIATLAISLAPLDTAFAAGHQGSMEDQMACTPDVYRLCAANVPDEDAIVACLKRNKKALSPACGRVFAAPAAQGDAPAENDPD